LEIRIFQAFSWTNRGDFVMSGVGIILLGITLQPLSGVCGCMFGARSMAGQRLTTALMMIGSALGLYGIWLTFGETNPQSIHLPWFLPWGQFLVTVDPISALFLGPVFVVPMLGSIYGWGYWKQSEHPQSGRRIALSYGFLAGAMAMVVIARDGILFLIAWEMMAISAYFAATAEEGNPDVRQAGWVYLIATHMGTLCLFAMFALWNHATGSFALVPAAGVSADLAGTLFLLALIGFGFKAGLMPLHVWLPGAHANAPSHVSAVMSGVMLKMGIYGIVRMTAVLPIGAMWWGGVLLLVGAISGIAGIIFAIGQRDIKRLLAYSSIENIGIVAMGVGLALLGRSLERPEWVLLGLSGAMLHVWNHSLFKSLLFFNAGAIIHATQTREMDLLGGLAQRMPRAAALFFVGAIAISALPPLNGFASEWLLYLGFFHALDPSLGKPGAAVALAAVVLATIGAMAVACFVKVLGTVFLGAPRSRTACNAHDPQPSMIVPMATLSAACLGLGLFPMSVAPLLERVVQTWAALPHSSNPPLAAYAPFTSISVAGLLLLALAGAFVLLLRMLLRTAHKSKDPTWGCGYVQPTSRIQYTGSSFVQSFVHLFRFILLPTHNKPHITGNFPKISHFKSVIPDVVLDRLAVPLFDISGKFFSTLRIMQQGHTHLYLIYIVTIVFILLYFGSL
jgi:hydrogenase-4 component B